MAFDCFAVLLMVPPPPPPRFLRSNKRLTCSTARPPRVSPPSSPAARRGAGAQSTLAAAVPRSSFLFPAPVPGPLLPPRCCCPPRPPRPPRKPARPPPRPLPRPLPPGGAFGCIVRGVRGGVRGVLFCLFDVRRRVEKNVSHWLKNGGVLRGSGRGGLTFDSFVTIPTPTR